MLTCVPELHAGGELDASISVGPVSWATASDVQQAGDTANLTQEQQNLDLPKFIFIPNLNIAFYHLPKFSFTVFPFNFVLQYAKHKVNMSLNFERQTCLSS